MSEFYKKFLYDDVRRLNPPSGRQIFLAAFGKHPGWDDHVEDLGLETESLILARTILYVDGIGGQINAGAWEKLDPSQQLAEFKHLFLWYRPGQFLLGRMWSSSDGKGRTRYPMVVCAHCAGLPLPWAVNQVLPRLEQIEKDCLLTQSASDVRAILERSRAELRSAMDNVATDTSPPILSPTTLAEFVAHPALGPNQEGWLRIIYQMQSQMAAFAPGKLNLKGDLSSLRPQQIRVPRSHDALPAALLLWTRFFLSQVDPATPLLLTLPMEEPWLDVTLGEPASQELFCLRASPKALPLASEVPYNLDLESKANAQKVLANFQAGGGTIIPLTAGGQQDDASPDQPSAPHKWFRWFKGGIA